MNDARAAAPDGRAFLALDIGATKTIVAAVAGRLDDGFRPLRRPVRFATPHDPDAFVEAVARAVAGALPPGVRPAAIGMAAPGPLDPVAGIVERATNLGWVDLPLTDLVGRRLGGIPAALEDDGNLGALGEFRVGGGRGADPFAFLSLGTGLGAGLIVRGRIARGAHRAAGEVGHLAVGERTGPRCSCGQRNCVEVWAGGAGIARRARDTWPASRLADGRPAPRDSAAVFALARTGDPEAVRLIGLARHALATAVAALCATVDPAAITVGGSIGRSQPAFVRSAVREGLRMGHWATTRLIELRRPKLGGWSVLVGAAVLAAQVAEERPG